MRDGTSKKALFNLFALEALSNTSRFDALFDLLVDNISKEVLSWAIKFRIAAFLTQSRDEAAMMVPSMITRHAHDKMLAEAKQLPEAVLEGNLDVDLIENYIMSGYNLPGLCAVLPSDNVFDFGAFNGNSSIVFSRLCPLGKVYAFEPNPSARAMLARNLEKMNVSNVEVVPCGVSDKAGKIRFKQDGAASRFDPAGNIEVETVTIDGYMNKTKPESVDFLKFDIEGFEQNAIRGAATTIRTFRPKIAISLYHLYNDMTTLPFMIKEIGGWYEFYLRHNAITGGELVLFCVPIGLSA